MKIALRILAGICILWAVLGAMIPTQLPPPIHLWWSGAIKEADEIVAKSGDESTVFSDTNTVSVSRSTLWLLSKRAKEPMRRANEAHFFLLLSSGFAFVAGVSVFLLSRKI
jgi:hypothetical protein